MVNTSCLVLVRHGMTDQNLLRVVSGGADVQLNQMGRLQVSELRRLLKDNEIYRTLFSGLQRIYSSPSKRALETAAAFGVEVIADARLLELDTGDLAGRIWDDILSKYPEYYSTLSVHGYAFKNPLANETFGQAIARLEAFAADRLQEHSVLVAVSHADIIRLLICKSLSLGLQHWNQIYIGNCGLALFRRENGEFRLNGITSDIERLIQDGISS